MTVKKILVEPNKLLREVSRPIKEVNKEIQLLMDDMLETMYSANGIGLAAIQIGVPKNLIVIDLMTKEKKKIPCFLLILKLLKKVQKCLNMKKDVCQYQIYLLRYRGPVNVKFSI